MSKKKSYKRDKKPREIHKHPFVVPVVTFIFLSFFTMFGLVFLNSNNYGPNDSYVVRLTVDDKIQTVPTKAENVADFLTRANIELQEGDIVEPAADATIDDDNFRINIYRARPVTIIDGEQRIQALSAATTPRSIANQVGIKVFPEDDLRQETSSDVLRDQVLGDKITIKRSVPVNVNLYGATIVLRTHAKTVSELLKEKNIILSSGDTIQPTIDTPIIPEIQIFLTRQGTQIITVEEVIPMEIQTVEDLSLSFGSTAIRQKGSPGKKLVTYQIEIQNGAETGRKVIQEVRIVEPVKQITARGKAISIPADKSILMGAAGIAVSDYPYVQFIINHENGLWCPTRWQGQNFCPPYYVEKFPGAESHKSTGYGMCQSTPANKMATAGEDWRTNAVTQLKWCSGYAQRYGGWEGAYNAWTRRAGEGRGWW